MIDEGGAVPVLADWLVQGGAGALVTLVVILIFTGRLVPRRYHDEVRAERDEWKRVALKAMGHTDLLLPAAQVATEVIGHLGDTAQIEQALSDVRPREATQ